MRTRCLPLIALLALAQLAPAQSAAPESRRASLYVTAAASSDFTGFISAVDAAGLGPVLDRGEEFTLFIPSDHAIAGLDPERRKALLLPDHPSALFAVVAHHLVRGRHTASDLRAMGAVRTVSGQLLDISPAGATLAVDGADIVRADIDCSNGVMHVIDAVLVPNTRDLLQTLKAEGRFRTLLELIDEADLEDFIEDNAPMTFFAPTDEAFSKLDRYLVSDLERSRNRAALVDLLKRHLVPGEHAAGALAAQGPQRSAAGALLDVVQTPDSLVVTDPSGTSRATIVRANLDGPGGVIHQIDTVILPPEGLRIVPDGRLIVGVFTGAVSESLAAQLNVRARECFLVGSLTRNGPAQRAGIKPNDVVVSLDGLPATSGNLDLLKARKGFGGVIEFELIRAGERMTVPVSVGVERD